MKACVDLPSSLDAVSDRTWLIWGMTGEEIANRLTLFPYYARYAHHKLAAQCLDALRSDNGVGVHPRFGLTSSRVRPPRFLRYCKACRERDLLRHGETYWRRSHQLAGVLMCPEHGEQLVDSDALLRPTEFGVLSMQRKARPTSHEQMAMVSVSLMRSMRLKSRIDAATYFWGQYQLGRGSTSRWRTVWRFWSAGFPEPLPPCIWPSSRRPSPNSMANPCYPSWVAGFSWERIPTGSGVFRARARKRSFHPLQHALVQVFSSSAHRCVEKNPFRPGALEMPESLCRARGTVPH